MKARHASLTFAALVSLSAAVPSTHAALTFEFNYLPGSGFLDPSVGEARQAANIFGSYSPPTVRIPPSPSARKAAPLF
jgi:hypothetical protein